MLRNRKYKNYLPLRDNPDPVERRLNLTKEVLKDGTFFPKPLGYEDIDQAMMDWSNDGLDLSFEGEKLPTIALYTNQRFEEYMQSWEHSDNKKNILLNFKTITRENNPKKGSINGSGTNNIPGDRFYTIHSEKIIDRNGQESYVDYQMKQPFAVDLTYKISLITGKYELLNKFNVLCQDIFKSGYAYLNVNGHYLYMKMEDPQDESEYAIDDRRYFSQTIQIGVKAYIIQDSDFRIEERPKMKFYISEGNSNVKVNIDEDEDSVVEDNSLYYKPLTLRVTFNKCEWNEIKMRIPYNMGVQKITTENIDNYTISIDGEKLENASEFSFEEGTTTILWIKRKNPLKMSEIIFNGFDKDTIIDENDIELDEAGEELVL